MAAQIWKTGTQNAVSTDLDGTLAAGATTIPLTSTTGLQAPGIITIERVDANGVASANVEYVSFTGISGNSLTGCTRGLAGTSDIQHDSGAKVEETWTVTHWGDFLTAFGLSHDTSGNIAATSLATLIDARVYRSLNMSGASAVFSEVTVNTRLYASGASLVGSFGFRPTWVMGGNLSGPTTSASKSLPMTDAGSWQFFVATLRTPASGGSLVIDMNKNGTSIFEAGTRPTIPGGGTFVSTASINTKAFVAGDTFTVDIDIGAYCDDLTVVGKG